MEFVKGLFFSRNEKAPEFVKGKLSIKVDEFIKYLEEKKNEKGYVNLNLKQSKKGIYYAELDNWTPDKKSVVDVEYPINNEDLPF